MNEMLSPETVFVVAKGSLALGYVAIAWVALVLVRGLGLEASRALVRVQARVQRKGGFRVQPIAGSEATR